MQHPKFKIMKMYRCTAGRALLTYRMASGVKSPWGHCGNNARLQPWNMKHETAFRLSAPCYCNIPPLNPSCHSFSSPGLSCRTCGCPKNIRSNKHTKIIKEPNDESSDCLTKHETLWLKWQNLCNIQRNIKTSDLILFSSVYGRMKNLYLYVHI